MGGWRRSFKEVCSCISDQGSVPLQRSFFLSRSAERPLRALFLKPPSTLIGESGELYLEKWGGVLQHWPAPEQQMHFVPKYPPFPHLAQIRRIGML